MIKQSLAAAVAALVSVAPLAASASNVQVTIVNNEAYSISLSTTNICGSTVPNPSSSIPAHSQFLFTNNNCSAQANSGHLTYQNVYPVASGSCRFDYSSIDQLNSLGQYQWVFNSNATPTGDAACTSKITSLNTATGDFAVTFTMKNNY